MSVTVEDPQRDQEEPPKLKDTFKETSEQEPGNVNNDADVKEDAESTHSTQKNGQNDKHDRSAPRIVMAYIPASAPASPAPLAPGRNTPNPEASDSERRPSTTNLTTKLNQAFDEYRAWEERVGDLGHQVEDEDEGYEGDASSPGEHHGCCEHDHEHYHEQYAPEYQQQYYDGRSPPSYNATWGWAPYQTASSPMLYMQPGFRPSLQEQHQQQYYQPATPPSYRPHRFPSSYHSHPYQFPYPHPPHLFSPSPLPLHHSGPRISTPHSHFHPASPYTSPSPAFPQPHPRPFPPQTLAQIQSSHLTDLTSRFQDIQAQLNGLDAAHEVEIWRHGKYNFHRRRAKELRKIKREKVEVMVGVVRELRGLGVNVRGRGWGGQYQGQQHGWKGQQGQQGQQQSQQYEEIYHASGPDFQLGLGYGGGGGFGQQQEQAWDQGWGYQLEVGQEARYGPGYGPGYEQHREQQQLFGAGGGYGHGYGHGQVGSGSWPDVELEVGHDGHGGCYGCGDDGGYVYVDSPRDSAFESLACEYGTTVDGEVVPEVETSEPSLSPTLDTSNETGPGSIDTTAGTRNRTRTFSLPLDSTRMEKPSQQQVETMEVDDGHEQQHDADENANENEQGENIDKKTSTRERAGSWSDAEVVISEELRGIWRQKMSE